jgi:penicillin-binding protein 1A
VVKKRRNIKKTIIKICLISILVGISSLFTFIGCIYYGTFGDTPTYNELENIKNDEASKIYTADNILIGKFFFQNRTNLRYKTIAPDVFNALIATEDARFYEHKGVDFRSLLRVVIKTIILGDKSAGGGSTLSQQLAKNLYGRERYKFLSMPINKGKEMITAYRLEKIYTKEEIITLYLNTVPFGENVYGIESASRRFFSKSAANLSTIEAATLIGMLKASTSYNPRLHPEKSLIRRNTVINQMLKYNFIKANIAEALKQKPIVLKYTRLSKNKGLATYLRENLRTDIKKIIKDYNKENKTDLNIYSEGFKIYTSIDSHLQKYAEEAVHTHMRSLQHSFYKHWGKRDPWYRDKSVLTSAMHRSMRYKQLKKAKISNKQINKIFKTKIKMDIYSPYSGERTEMMSPLDSIKHYLKILHTGFLAIDPRNGNIQAWVGGIDHKYFKYDQVKAKRQTGSVFKPIVYAAALENGEDPRTLYSSERKVYKEYNNWSPRNSDNKNEKAARYSMKGAIEHSINTIAVEVLIKTGFMKTISMAKDMGIEGELPEYPSLALGVSNSSLYEMCQVFSTFANNGEWIKPSYITKVTDKDGNMIYQKKAPEKRIVMSAENANIMNYMLEGVINEGTGRRLRGRYGLKNCLAGKTGTSQNNADGWFIGYNPHIVAGVRTGAEDMRVHFKTTYLGQGANTASPIFAIFMQKALKDPRFSHWNNIQFPNIMSLSPRDLDNNIYTDSLDIPKNADFKKMIQKKKAKEEKANKKKPGIWKRIKNIFKKKKK